MSNINDYSTFTKSQLRTACKEAGISYKGLNNDGMRLALRNAADEAEVVDWAAFDPSVVEQAEPEEVLEEVEEEAPVVPGPSQHVTKGARVARPQGAPKAPKEKKERVLRTERNGVKRPLPGGVCAQVWDALDAAIAAGTALTSKELPALAEQHGWNLNNVKIEFYGWRKYNAPQG